MRNFYSAKDVDSITGLLDTAFSIKSNPHQFSRVGKDKLLVLLFFNPSLRTRISTQKAAYNLGMNVISMDMTQSWKWEFDLGVTMDKDSAEHVKEAANVIGQYADIVAIRSFPSLNNKEEDFKDEVIQNYIKFSPVPVVNLESSIRHPLQSLADLMTIKEHYGKGKPKIVLSWAPHPKALPQAVASSFLEWMTASDLDVTITHPEGYALDEQFTSGHQVISDQVEAFKNADVIYVKNWSSSNPYGKVLNQSSEWTITKEKLKGANNPILMHCLPVRRNVVISDDAIDSQHSVIIQQAENRLYTAQAILYTILNNLK